MFFYYVQGDNMYTAGVNGRMDVDVSPNTEYDVYLLYCNDPTFPTVELDWFDINLAEIYLIIIS